jgi:hypothetical protein
MKNLRCADLGEMSPRKREPLDGTDSGRDQGSDRS